MKPNGFFLTAEKKIAIELKSIKYSLTAAVIG